MGHTSKTVIIRARITADSGKELQQFISTHPTLNSVSATLRYALDRLMKQERRKKSK